MKWINLFGVALVLVGSALLYFFGVPWKEIKGGVLFGPLMVSTESKAKPAEWEPQANISIKNSRRYSKLGFALIAFGSALQLVAIGFSEG